MEYPEWKDRLERTFLDRTGFALERTFFGDLYGLWLADYTIRGAFKLICDVTEVEYDPEWVESDILTGREKALKLG